MTPDKKFSQSQFDQYAAFLKSTETSPASIQRKLSSLASFQKFLIKKKYISAPVETHHDMSLQNITQKKYSIPLFKGDHRGFRGFSKYLIITSLIIIASGLSYGLYTQTILKARKNLAYSTATSPTRPSRSLSFQGRLTDSSGNPISSSTGIIFRLYDTATVGTGTSLYSSDIGNSQTVTPDSNGIFSVIIGKTHGTEIPDTVFNNNASVYLEITAGGETMSPRQPIATVAYALNAETLQGLPPSASGLKDTVMVIDSLGNLNLGETSPTIKSVSGTMAIEGQSLLLKASDGSGGNVEINPDAAGIIKLTTEGVGTTVQGFISATNANLTNGNLYEGIINNVNRNYNFLEFKNYSVGTSLVSRFSVSANGNVTAAGNLSVGIGITTPKITLTTGANNGYLLQSDASGNATWVSATGIGGTYTAGNGLNLSGSQFKLGGALTEATRFNIGSTEVMYLSTSGNVGIGTTSPNTKLDVRNNNNSVAFFTNTNTSSSSEGAGMIGYSDDGAALSSGDRLGFFLLGGSVNTSHTLVNSVGIQGNAAENWSATNQGGYLSFLTTPIGSTTTSRAERMRIDGSGNVGIGTTNPLYTLQVGGTGTLGIGGTAYFASFVGIGTTGPAKNLEIQTSNGVESGIRIRQLSQNYWDFTSPASSSRLAIGDVGAERLTILATTGNVGIGTTLPKYKFEVSGDALISTRLGIGATDANYSFHTTSNGRFDTNLDVGGTGNINMLGIGTVPTQRLHLVGTFRDESLGTWKGTIAFPLLANQVGYIELGDIAFTGAIEVNLNGGWGSGAAFGQLVRRFSFYHPIGGSFSNYNSEVTSAFGEIASRYAIGDIEQNGTALRIPVYQLSGSYSNTLNARVTVYSSSTTLDNQLNALSITAPATVANSATRNNVSFNNTNVGIGTTNPLFKLDVNGNVNITTNLNVGVGITTPKITLTTGANNGYLLQSDANGTASWVSAVGIGGTYTAGNGLTLSGSQFKLGGALTEATRFNIGSTEVMYLSTSGNVGIGTTNPSARLQIYNGQFHLSNISAGETAVNSNTYAMQIGSAAARSTVAGTYYGGIAFNHLLNYSGTSYNVAPQAWIGTRLNNTSGSELDYLVFATKSGTGTSNSGTDIPIERMAISPTGNVGIGTTSPGTKLDILQSGDTNQFRTYTSANTITPRTYSTSDGFGLIINSYQSQTGGAPYLRTSDIVAATGDTSGSELRFFTKPASANPGANMVINKDGNVGIGTTSPGKKLEVSNSILASDTAENSTIFRILNPDTSGTLSTPNRIGIGFGSSTTRSAILAGTYGNDFMDFYTNGDLTNAKLRINATGNVGIGSTNPITKLQISGARGTGNVGQLLVTGVSDHAYITVQADTPSTKEQGIQFVGAGSVGTPDWGIKIGANSSDLSFANVAHSLTSLTLQDSTGNVGVGTTNPNATLHVVTSGGATPFRATNSDYNATTIGSGFAISFGAASSDTYTKLQAFDAGGSSVNDLILQSAGGNVGIGITNPGTSKLYVLNDTLANDTRSLVTSIAGGADPTLGPIVMGMYVRPSATGANRFGEISVGDNGAWRNLVLAGIGGNVGIGTTNPTNLLQISTDTAGKGFLLYDDVSGRNIASLTRGSSSNDPGMLQLYNAGAETIRLNGESGTTSWINNSGNFGIGTTNPTYKLHVIGDANITTNLTVGGTLTFTGTNIGSGTTALFVDSSGIVTKRALGGLAFQNSTDLGWVLKGNSGTAQTIGVGDTASILGTNGLNSVASATDTVSVGLGGTLTANTNLNLASYSLSFLGLGNTQSLFLASNGTVGIGTTAPGQKLDITSSTVGSRTAIRIANADQSNTTTQSAGIQFSPDTRQINGGFINVGKETADWSAGNVDTFMSFGLDRDNAQYEMMRINSNGYLGIGTTNPLYKLDLQSGTLNIGPNTAISEPTAETGYRIKLLDNGGINNDFGIGVGDAGSGQQNLWVNAGPNPGNDIRFMFGTNGEKVRFKYDGSVGIGTTNPQYKLDVNGDARIQANGAYRFGRADGVTGNEPQIYTTNSTVGKADFMINTGLGGGGNVMTILSGGNVGIGNTNPQALLHVGSNGNPQILFGDATATTKYGVGRWDYGGMSVTGLFANNAYSNAAIGLGFDNSGTPVPAVTIKQSGNVGIGNTNPQTTLHIQQATTNPIIQLQRTGDTGFAQIQGGSVPGLQFFTYSAGSIERMRIDNNGNVGIGTTNPTHLLELSGNKNDYLSYIYNIGTSASSGGLYVRSDGNGNLLNLNNNGSDLVTVSPTNAAFNIPTSFTSAGDVSLAYDLYFTNSTASYIKSQGPMYIQTESPSANLDLNLTAANAGKIYLNSTVVANSNLSVGGTLALTQGAANGYILQSDASGNAAWVPAVGIGGTYSATNGLTMGVGASNVVGLGGTLTQNTSIGTSSFNLSFLGLGGTQSLFIKSNGSVGIGTTNPGAFFHVRNTGTTGFGPNVAEDTSAVKLASFELAGPTGREGYFHLGGSNIPGNDSVLFVSNQSITSGFAFATRNSSQANIRMVVNSSGNVGIGTTTPISKFQVIGSGQMDNLVLSGNLQLSGYWGFVDYLNSDGGLGTGGIQRITANGNIANIGSIQAGQLNITSGGTFAAKVDYTAGTNPFYVASVDFNGDGKADMAVANGNGASVSVFLNNGNGTFATKADYATATTPRSIATADFNGDGKADIVAGNYTSNTVSVLLNNGNGTFATKADYATGNNPYSVTTADFNGDGKADMAVAGSGTSAVSVLINNGNGTFATKADYATGIYPQSVTSADLNGDGKIDLAVADTGTTAVSILINNGNGTFATKVDYSTGNNPYFVTAADLNGDGKADLVVANPNLTSVSILINNGDGTFATKVDYGTGTTPMYATTGDLNGDGKADIAITNTDSNTVSIFLNNGNGTFATKVDYSTGTNPRAVIATDFNGDGKADLAVADYGSTAVSVFLNNSTTTLFTSTAGNVGIGTTNPTQLLDIEKNQDAATRILVGNTSTGTSARNDITFTQNGGSQGGGFGYLNSAYNAGAGTEALRSSSLFMGSNSSATGGISIFSAETNAPITFSTAGYTAANERLRITSIGNVGIGTTNPSSILHLLSAAPRLTIESSGAAGPAVVIGTDNSSGIAAPSRFFIGQGTTAPYLTINTISSGSAGNVGIGTTSPTAKLEVNGVVKLSGGVTGSAPAYQIDMGSYYDNTGDPSVSHINLYGGSVGFGMSSGRFNIFSGAYDTFFMTNSTTPTTVIKTSGNVGIGTTNPLSKLQVDGIQANFPASGTTPNSIWQLGSTAYDVMLYGGVQASSPYPVYLQASSPSNLAVFRPLVLNPNGGNVGIGTTSPNYKLEVNGTGYFGQSVTTNANFYAAATLSSGLKLNSSGSNYGSIQNDAANTWSLGYTTSGGTTLGTPSLTWNSSGYIGIGTTNPLAKLVSRGTAINGISNFTNVASGYGPIVVGTGNYVANDIAALDFDIADKGGIARIGAMATGSGSYLLFGTSNSYASGGTNRVTNTAMAIDYNGNVGIGTTNPLFKLDVNGNVNIATNLTVGGTLTFTGVNVNVGTGTTALFIDPSTNIVTKRGLGDLAFQNSVSMGWVAQASANQTIGIGTTLHLDGVNGLTTTSVGSSQITFGLGGTLTANTNIGTSSFSLSFLGLGNTQSLFIASSGNVGIGTTNPLKKLQITDSLNSATPINEDASLFIYNSDNTANNLASIGFNTGYNSGVNQPISKISSQTTGAGSKLYFQTSNNYATGITNNAMVIDYNGNVGIGNTNPQSLLSVGSNANGTAEATNKGSIQIQSSGGGSASGGLGLEFKSSASASGYGWHIGAPDLGSSNVPLIFSTRVNSAAWSEQMRLTNSGNLGIGTTLPLGGLDVYKNAGAGGYASVIRNNYNAVTYNGLLLSTVANDATTYVLHLKSNTYDPTTGGTSLMVVKGNGTVGIGTTNPNNKFVVSNAGAQGFEVDPVSYSTGTRLISYDRSASTWKNLLLNDGGGNVGIGTTNPTYKLEVVSGNNNPFYLNGTYNKIQANAGFTEIESYHNTRMVIDSTSSYSDRFFSIAKGASYINGGSPIELFKVAESGNVGIGTTNPIAKLDVEGSNVSLLLNDTSLASRDFYLKNTGGNIQFAPGHADYNYDFQNNAATSLFYIKSTGNVGIGITTPTSKLYISGIGFTGNFLTINDGSSDLFNVSSAQSTFNNPTSFTSAGDVSVAYDLNFTNPTASYIKSSAPLYLQSGESFNSSDLTLRTFNNGDVVFDSPGGVTLNQAQNWTLATGSTQALNISSGLLNLDTSNNRVGIGTTAPDKKLSVDVGTNAYFTVSGNTAGIGDINSLWNLRINANTVSTYGSNLNLVASGGAGTSENLVFSTNDATLGLGERVRITSNGKVGIGTTNPNGKLEVAGNQVFTLNGVPGTYVSGSGITLPGTAGLPGISSGIIQTYSTDFSLWTQRNYAADQTEGVIAFGDDTNSGLSFEYWPWNGTGTNSPVSVMSLKPTGYVGIGNTNPTSPLSIGTTAALGVSADLFGSIKASRFIDKTNDAYFLLPANSDPNKNSLSLLASGSIKFNVGDTGASPVNAINGAASKIQNYTNGLMLGVGTGSTAVGTVISGWDSQLFLNNNGNVGIGTTAPIAKLTVAGSSGLTRSISLDNREIKFRGDSLSHFSIFGPETGFNYLTIQNTSSNGAIGTTGADLLTILTTGNVGIGTTNPLYKLDITGTLNLTSNLSIGGTIAISSTRLFTAANGTVSTPAYSFTSDTNTGLYLPITDNLAIGTSGVERLRINASGFVGIGTTNPRAQLEIVGEAQGFLNTSAERARRDVYSPTTWVNTGSTLPGGLYGSQSSIIGDYVYLFGGNGGSNKLIYKAPVTNPTSWVDTGSTLPGPVIYSQSVILSDYVYLFGGYDNLGTYLNTIYRAPVSNPTAWVNTNSTLPVGFYNSNSAILGDYVYLFGGYNGSGSLNTIYRAPISNPTVWTNAGSLPVAASQVSTAVIGDNIYLFGAYLTNTIYKAPVNNPTYWTNTGSTIPSGWYAFQSVVIGDYVYLLGDYTSTSIYRAPISNPTSFVDTGSTLPTKSYLSQISVIGDYVYMFGGNNGISNNSIYRAGIKGASAESQFWKYAPNIEKNRNQSLTTSIFSDGAGRIGIGTISPGVRLQINGGDQSAPTLGSAVGGFALTGSNNLYGMYAGVSTNGDTWLQSQRNDASTSVYRLLLNPSGGNVGIGTTNPTAQLDIGGASSTISNSSGDITLIPAGNVSVSNKYITNLAGILGNSSIAGNFGVGTTNPIEKIHIVGNARMEGGQVRFYTAGADSSGTTGLVANANGWTRIDPNGSRFVITASATDVGSSRNILDIERTDTWTHLMELRANGSAFFGGNVSIGISGNSVAPAAVDLQVGGAGLQKGDASPNSGYLRFGDNTGWKFHIGRMQESSGGAINTNVTGALVTFLDNGNVGIGITTPAYKLQVNGQPAANGYTTFTNYSDARLKENIQTLSTGSLDKILKLNPVTFNYNDKTGYGPEDRQRTITGFIAQELLNVFPDMVGKTYINGVEYYDTNLSAIPIHLVKAIQEQQAEIQTINNSLSIHDTSLSVQQSQIISMSNILKDVVVDQTGQIDIQFNVSDQVLESLGYYDLRNEIQTAQYKILDTNGNIVSKIGQFYQLAAAKIKTGYLLAGNIITHNIVSDKIISTVIKTNNISPATYDVKTVNINSNAFVGGKLVVEADPSLTPSSKPALIVHGDASVSGQLVTDSIQAKTATISTIYADNIISKEGSFGDIMTQKIASLREELKKFVISNPDTESTPSALLADSSNWSASIASDSAKITGDLSLSNNLIVGSQLTVQGDTQLGNAFITGTFTTGEIAIKDNFIETTNAALFIQPSAIGSVHILGDTLVIADTGDVTVNGNLTVSNKLTTTSLFANLIAASEASISGKLTIGSTDPFEATASAQLALDVHGGLNTNKINIATDSAQIIIAQSGFAQLATSSAELNSNATAGTATLPTGKTEIIIHTNKLTSNSMIYLTPNGSTQNQVVYVKSKEANSFTIAIDQPLISDVNINWWIIN